MPRHTKPGRVSRLPTFTGDWHKNCFYRAIGEDLSAWNIKIFWMLRYNACQAHGGYLKVLLPERGPHRQEGRTMQKQLAKRNALPTALLSPALLEAACLPGLPSVSTSAPPAAQRMPISLNLGSKNNVVQGG